MKKEIHGCELRLSNWKWQR